MSVQLLVVAKTPVPGRVKTRLCPPCTPGQAARIAAAALADTVRTVNAATAADRVLLIDGDMPAPPGWRRVDQRGGTLGNRLAAGFTDSARTGVASVLIGMDTPQVTPELLETAAHRLTRGTADAVLGLAEDGGWWLLGLRDPARAAVLREVTMSTAQTGQLTLTALRGQGLQVAAMPVLRDVDTAGDLGVVAGLCAPGSRFAAVVS
ncbi:TIGR04282 family arsenosugar biosynthesis glycosyltransferase [Actinoplanes sp. TFC3]|uniref:TIGR04282 family arsenosugar biosynthesis glycosyltransferase n=1 Tax=Actinoplanes sp. TFC3 TaxID=1710355 RepID=UPI0008373852|nr:TIGR04282 family arsenosugar biosynthesis glycosyltransferase [Actinoplanes sp. TFC3]